VIAFGLALDTTALLAYSATKLDVGHRIAKAADRGADVLVPALCLALAHQQATASQWEMLEVLAGLPHIRITPVEADMCSMLGGWSRRLAGQLDLAQLAMDAAAHPLVPILTDRRELLGEVLPKEWPIIDL
jgi:hypothetical protein